ncbi:MAG: response regulator [Syntrophomonadaceae bacterium]|nr:response regulator [Syntrophomonadaceae bacterium]
MEKIYQYIVVEDEDLIRNNIIKKIENLRMPFALAGSADNGQDALAIIDRCCPDIVFTDIKMPIMDGLELAEELHFSYPQIKIIIITAYQDFLFAQKAIRFGVNDYILKPVDLCEMEALLNRILESFKISGEKSYRLFSGRNTEKCYTKEETIRMVENYIRKNYQNEITLGTIAEEAGFTPDYLSRLFKKRNKESPVKFLTRIRVEKAKNLLIELPEAEVGIIGEMVGYKDPYYFSRVFKTNTGMYPTEFRKMSRLGRL